LLLAAVCAVLGACSHSGGHSAAPLIKRHPGGAGAASSAADNVDPGPTDLVSAVSGGGGDGPIGLKFQLGQRPVAGQPLVITLRLVANQALEHLEARFHTDEGLVLTQGGDFDPGTPLDAGATLDHTLSLVPGHEGVFTILATVTTGSAAEAVSRSFVIPIVVGAAAPAAPAALAAKPR
jgi:hypothetical protein